MAFKAVYPGVCKRSGCGQPILVGQMIVAYNRPAKGTWMHAAVADCDALRKLIEAMREQPSHGGEQKDYTPQGTPVPDVPDFPEVEGEPQDSAQDDSQDGPQGDSPREAPGPQKDESTDDLFEQIFKRAFARLDKADYLRTGKELDTTLKKHIKEALKGYQPSQGSVPERSLTVVVKRAEFPDVKVPMAHNLLPRIIRMLSGTTRHLYVWGPPGSGKSTAVRQAAKALGLDYYYRSLAPSDTPSKLEGFIDVHGTVRDTEFVRLVRDGGIVCLEEVDNAASSLLVVLNNVLENGQASFPGGMVEVHKDFRLVACANTSGRGGDVLFPERRPLDSAFLDRFYKVYFGYDEVLEREIVTAQYGVGMHPWVDWVQKARKWAHESRKRVIISPRASIAGSAALAAGESVDDVVEGTVLSGVPDDTRKAIRDATPWSHIKVVYAPEVK